MVQKQKKKRVAVKKQRKRLKKSGIWQKRKELKEGKEAEGRKSKMHPALGQKSPM